MAGLVEKLVLLVGQCVCVHAHAPARCVFMSTALTVPFPLTTARRAFYSDEHVVVLRALIREKFMKVSTRAQWLACIALYKS